MWSGETGFDGRDPVRPQTSEVRVRNSKNSHNYHAFRWETRLGPEEFPNNCTREFYVIKVRKALKTEVEDIYILLPSVLPG